MRPRCFLKTALCAALVLMLQPRLALAQAPACRSSTDVMYAVKRDETLSEIAARFYCVTAESTITRVWEAVYDYNRVVAGPNPHAIPIDTILCLPAHVDGTGWQADRCVERDRSSPPVKVNECGNGRREASEVCDGDDLGGMTCSRLGLSSGKLSCRADCTGFDLAGCGQGANAPVQRAPAEKEADAPGEADGAPARSRRDARDRAVTRKQEKLLRRASAELIGGLAVPLSGAVWNYDHRTLGMVGVGARVTLGWIEVAPRALFVGGQHGTKYPCPLTLAIENCPEEAQQVLGGGLAVQAGIPLRVGPLRLTPGLELGWLYVHRAIDQTMYPWKGTDQDLSRHLPLVGVFFRPEYELFTFSRFSVALELGGEMLPMRLNDNASGTVTMNFNAKMVGGLSYVF